MIDVELRAYIEVRRLAVEASRRVAVHQTGEWAADGALHELDRLEGWLNLRRQQEFADRLVREVTEAQHRHLRAATIGREAER